MKKLSLFIVGFLLVVTVSAQAPDAPISPVEAVSMLGKGVLMEPSGRKCRY